MLPETFCSVLETMCVALRETDSIWAVTGSVGFALHGMDIPVNDLDLQTDKCGAYHIEQCFSEHIIRPVTFSSSKTIRSHFGELRINAITVEIMGDLQKGLPTGQWESPVDIRSICDHIPYRGVVVPVLSLTHEYEAYQRMGRTDKAAAIKAHLERL